MATVVITFFLITRFYVCKMDADFKEKSRERISSRREKRWSMNSQRLEEIVAELMRPMRDLRHCFDTDLSALLEEYLTEAGLHALEAEDDDEEEGGEARPEPPNFAELALLLQQSANIYGRKVDALYQHVLSVSDSLHNSIEMAYPGGPPADGEGEDEAEAGAASPARRKRKASSAACGEFTYIALAPAAGARRDAGAARPPPTLPRVYVELEPRLLADGDVPLTDYAGEPVGLMQDFQVNMRLQDGLLVDELESPTSTASSLRPIPLMELQAAIEAAAPPSPPPLREESPPPEALAAPPHCSTPLPPDGPRDHMPPPPAPLKRERKRKNDANINDIVGGTVKLLINMKLRRALKRVSEFEVTPSWVARVVAARRAEVLALRRRLTLAGELPDMQENGLTRLDVNGFAGWSATEASVAGSALAAARALARRGERLADDSDDDGFFEQSEHSSLGDCDHSRSDEPHTQLPNSTQPAAAEAAEWAAGGAGEALDVRALAAAVLRALPAAGAAPEPFGAVLGAAATRGHDVSRLFLATLFLANAGNVEVVQGPPLSLNSFSLRLLSADPRLYCAAAAAEPPVR
ncbi:uncharacterized protein LOC126371578 [Pectinophora gossypiella]|uniref:uncharacterized protein LOC126371578 n=1 Tax=Pectinophora gossypiella TaxID=13191 RepID=UPI00214E5F51|nr:uncharacterized protein LOC126371578 [Pectinophora gossypiella]